MLTKQIDILSIGDITTDAFIRLKDPHIHCRVDHNEQELCLPFGDKIPFEYVKIIKAAGNAGNAAICAARLGLRTALVSNVGDDQNGTECRERLQKNSVITSLVKVHKNKPTNYHFVLWYGVDRTILVNHTEFDYTLPDVFKKNSIKSLYSNHGLPPKWVYLTSSSPKNSAYYDEIADYLEANPKVKMAFQPGTFQLKLGYDQLKRIYHRADILLVNMEEAHHILNAHDEKRGIKGLLISLVKLGPKMVIVTDSSNGSFMYDHDHFYQMPIYPDPRPPFERTGCGDAFSATFVSALALGCPPLEALMWAPINPMSVAQYIGSHEGLLSREDLKWWLERAPEEYRPREI